MKTKLFLITALFIFWQAVFSQQTPLTITPQSNGFAIQFALPNYTLSDTIVSESFDTQEIFKYIKIDRFGYSDNVGYPELPQITFDLPVSQQASEFQIVLSNPIYEEIQLNRRVLPSQEGLSYDDEETTFELNELFYTSNGDTLNFRWRISDPYIVFGEKGIAVSIFPFAYNPQMQKIQVLKQATFIFSYQSGGTSTRSGDETDFSEIKENYLSNFFRNSSNSDDTTLYVSTRSASSQLKGRYLMITAPEFETTLTPFANYKRNLGYEVSVVTTNVTGSTSTSLKSYLQNVYDNNGTRPDFVLLVGDTDKIPASGGKCFGRGGK